MPRKKLQAQYGDGYAHVWSPKMGSSAFQQRTGLPSHIPDSGSGKVPRIGYIQWNKLEFWQVRPHERPQRGDFLPIFWDVPRANTHAVEDIGAVVDWLTEHSEFCADAKSNLAVLHNRNDVTNLFRASNWVSSSEGTIVSRGAPLVRADSSYGYPCPNQSWLPDRRPQKVLSCSA